jgi:hypothetical protein
VVAAPQAAGVRSNHGNSTGSGSNPSFPRIKSNAHVDEWRQVLISEPRQHAPSQVAVHATKYQISHAKSFQDRLLLNRVANGVDFHGPYRREVNRDDPYLWLPNRSRRRPEQPVQITGFHGVEIDEDQLPDSGAYKLLGNKRSNTAQPHYCSREGLKRALAFTTKRPNLPVEENRLRFAHFSGCGDWQHPYSRPGYCHIL